MKVHINKAIQKPYFLITYLSNPKVRHSSSPLPVPHCLAALMDELKAELCSQMCFH